MNFNDTVLVHAQKLWNFNCLNQKIVNSDVIILLGMRDLNIARYGAMLMQKNLASYVICTGNTGRCSRGSLDQSEASLYKDILIGCEVNTESILIEDQASNMGQNFEFSLQLLKEKNIKANSFIIVQAPFLQRRAWQTFKHFFPQKKGSVSYYNVSFKGYQNELMTQEEVIHFLVGEIYRLIEYPKKGFFDSIEIPDKVIASYDYLVDQGFTSFL